MNRKIWLASTVALASMLSISTPLVAFAGTPLLSGYGAPGAGEQAIVGSTLLGGNGGAGSGGSRGSSGLAGMRQGSYGQSPPGGGLSSTRAGNGRVGSLNSSSNKGEGVGPPAGHAGTPASYVGTTAFAYPESLRSAPASSPLGLSGGDIALLAGMVALLVLVGTLTLRLARLQP
jgi:hypothetical protein